MLEISGAEAAAAWCGQLFVRAGCEVTRAEPARRPAPEPDRDLFLNAGKSRVTADPGSSEIADLAAGHDVVITDARPADLREHGLLGLPAPVVVSITPFGLSGPHAGWVATEATLLALAGHTYLSGDTGRAPLTMPGQYPSYLAGSFAFVAAGSALLARTRARIEVSVLECLATAHQHTDTMWTEEKAVRGRSGNRWGNLHPITLLPAPDGWSFVNVTPNFWRPFAAMIGRPELADVGHPWARSANRVADADQIDQVILKAIGNWPKGRVFADGQGVWRVPTAHLQTIAELLDDPHLAERRFWRPAGESMVTPGSPYRLHRNGTRAGRAPAGAPRRWRSPQPGRPPLRGLRVLDLTHVWSGPLAGRLLGDLGADVIKVEPPGRRWPAQGAASDTADLAPGLRPWNRQPVVNKLNRNRRSLMLDLKTSEGREVFLRLADRADVLLQNFSARVLPSLGLGQEVLTRRNPRLIHVAMPGFGLSGPYADYLSFGSSIETMTGLSAVMGYSDDEPRVTSAAVVDAQAGIFAAVAVMDALLDRQRSGTGSLVELSQHECGISYSGEFLLRRQLDGREPARMGNADPAHAPSGVYRCRGDDQWIALSARTDDQWLALAGLAARGWQKDDRFRDMRARLAHREDLDREVELFTTQQDKIELNEALQRVGVPSGAVLSAPEWLADPHLEARGYYSNLADADRPPRRGDGLPFVIDGIRDYRWWRRAPTLGEHNAEILSEIGFAPDEIRDLELGHVIGDGPLPTG